MYFDPDHAQTIVGRFCRALREGGHLFLGHAENLRGVSTDFDLCHTHETFYYQRKERISDAAPQEAIERGSPLPAFDQTDTWVEVIRSTAEHIETLVAPPPRPAAAASTAAAAASAWDLGLALELVRKERFTEALAIVESLPPESSRDPDVLLLHAVLLTHGGAFDQAEQACKRLLEVDGLSAGAHYLLALCREGRGDRPAALHHDQVAIYLDPGFAMPRLHLGLLARRSGDRPAARRDLGQALFLLQREDASRIL